MLLSKRLRADHKPGDCGKALEGYAELAEELEAIVNHVAHVGVDFGYGKVEITDEHIEQARNILSQMEKEDERN